MEDDLKGGKYLGCEVGPTSEFGKLMPYYVTKELEGCKNYPGKSQNLDNLNDFGRHRKQRLDTGVCLSAFNQNSCLRKGLFNSSRRKEKDRKEKQNFLKPPWTANNPFASIYGYHIPQVQYSYKSPSFIDKTELYSHGPFLLLFKLYKVGQITGTRS